MTVRILEAEPRRQSDRTNKVDLRRQPAVPNGVRDWRDDARHELLLIQAHVEETVFEWRLDKDDVAIGNMPQLLISVGDPQRVLVVRIDDQQQILTASRD